jgi:uncharacterized protein with PQ loop repeat
MSTDCCHKGTRGVLLLSVLPLCGCEDLVIRDTSSLLVPGFRRSEIVGLVAGFGTTFAAVPGLVAMLKRRSSVGMNPRMAGIMGIFQIAWVFYGLLIASWLVERVNLSLRQHVAAIGRRTSTLCKGEAGLRQQLGLYQVYYNFVLPHASLRQPLAEPVATQGHGSAKRWRPCTPAMAAGLTDHIWSLKEVLLYRVPPWPQPQPV